jgi:hypothetical protein
VPRRAHLAGAETAQSPCHRPCETHAAWPLPAHRTCGGGAGACSPVARTCSGHQSTGRPCRLAGGPNTPAWAAEPRIDPCCSPLHTWLARVIASSGVLLQFNHIQLRRLVRADPLVWIHTLIFRRINLYIIRRWPFGQGNAFPLPFLNQSTLKLRKRTHDGKEQPGHRRIDAWFARLSPGAPRAASFSTCCTLIRRKAPVGRQFARDNRGLDGWLLFVFGLRPTGIGEIWLNIAPRTLITSFNSVVISKAVIAFVVMLVLIDYFTSGFLIYATKIGGGVHGQLLIRCH